MTFWAAGSNSCSSFLSLKKSYHLPYVTDPDWSPSGCCKMCFCCAQGERKCTWEYIFLDFLLLRASLHLMPGAVEYVPWTGPAPQHSSTGIRPLDICSEYLTVYLDTFKAVNYTHCCHREKKNHHLSSPDNLWEGAWAEDAQMNGMPKVEKR